MTPKETPMRCDDRGLTVLDCPGHEPDQGLMDTAERLCRRPNLSYSDFQATAIFIDEFNRSMSATYAGVGVALAVIELQHADGYPVGHLIWDCELESFRFAPAIPKD
jgi:hypothetical protein